MNFQTNNDLAFQFRLARDLKLTVAQLRSSMSAEEFAYWVQYYIYEEQENNKAYALAEAESKKGR